MAEQPPTVRKRFVTRARALQKHKPFLFALEEVRIWWQSEYPAIPLGPRGFPPHAPVDEGTEVPMPALVRGALCTARARLEAGQPPAGLTELEVAGAKWLGRVRRIMERARAAAPR